MSRIDIKPRIVEDLEKYELYRDKKRLHILLEV